MKTLANIVFRWPFFGAALAQQIDLSLDVGKVVQYAVAHDLVEAHIGDVTVWESEEVLRAKLKDERLAADKIAHDYPNMPWLAEIFKDYDKLDTPEKKYVYALDKLYPHVLILVSDHHPVHPSWEAYKRTEDIARAKIAKYPALLPLFDELCGMFRERPHFFSTPIPVAERKG